MKLNLLNTHYCHLFRAYIVTGYHSKAFKTVYIILLYKLKKNKQQIKLYCLIVFLNILKKLFEKILSLQLFQIIETNNLFFKFQMSM